MWNMKLKDGFCFVMENLKGGDLTSRLPPLGFAEGEASIVLSQACNALLHAHALVGLAAPTLGCAQAASSSPVPSAWRVSALAGLHLGDCASSSGG